MSYIEDFNKTVWGKVRFCTPKEEFIRALKTELTYKEQYEKYTVKTLTNFSMDKELQAIQNDCDSLLKKWCETKLYLCKRIEDKLELASKK